VNFHPKKVIKWVHYNSLLRVSMRDRKTEAMRMTVVLRRYKNYTMEQVSNQLTKIVRGEGTVFGVIVNL
jgi:hypothetical protein